ncbi:hypothetical protein Tco_0592534 [Tanacetum coccineum]
MFAFCRYIKLSSSKTLIDSLSNVWIGKLRLHANVARFDMKMVVKSSHVGVKVNNLVANKDSQPCKASLSGEANVEDGNVDEHVLEVEIQETANKVLHSDEPIDSDPFGCALIPKDEHQVSESFHKQSNGDSHKQIGFSMIERLEETIKVGMALGLNMEGCFGDFNKRRWVCDLCNRRFNEVREAGERFGSIFNERQAKIFNEFITNASLIDIPLGGLNFTWTYKWGSKMSKLLQVLSWRKRGRLYEPQRLYNFLREIDHLENKDIAQKAKIKWAIEGDENTSFFHGMLKKKRRQLAIKGILKNGEWIKNPEYVKAKFMEHFCNRFQQSIGIPSSLDADSLNHLASSQSEFLEQHFSREEIKRAV